MQKNRLGFTHFNVRCFTICLLCSFAAPAISQDSLARPLAREYLEIIRDTIVYYHQFGRTREGREALYAGHQLAEGVLAGAGSADSVHVQDLIIAADEIQRPTRCGHLQLSPARSKRYRKRFAYQKEGFGVVRVPEGTYHLVDTLRTNDTLLPMGTQIIALQQRVVTELIGDLSAFGGANDAGYYLARNYRTAMSLSHRYGDRYGWPDTMQVRYVSAVNNDTLVTSFATRVEEDTTGAPSTSVGNGRRLRRTRKRTQYERNWSFGPTEEDSSVYLMALRSFTTDRYRDAGYRKLIKAAFRELKEKQITRLIVDLRGNGGGSLVAATYLGRFLSKQPITIASDSYSSSAEANGRGLYENIGMWMIGVRRRRGESGYHLNRKLRHRPLHKDAFTGTVALILNEYSFSATTLLARALMDNGSATAYGRRTGAATDVVYGGSIKSFKIGHEGDQRYTLRVPNFAIVPINPQSGTVTPDVIVPRTLNSIVERRDDALLRAIADLRSAALD